MPKSMPGKINPDSWREALKFMGRCPLCEGAYESKDARRFAQVGPANLVHLTCNKCSSGFVAMVMVGVAGLSSVGMVTDLNYEDARQLYNKEPITLDEVISGHEYLQNHLF